MDRRKTRALFLRSKSKTVQVGGDAPISVQTMTTTKTHRVDQTLQEIASLSVAGADVIRVAVPTHKDILALPKIVQLSPVPIIADIHFNYKYILQAIESGCAGVRVNPGNIKDLNTNLPHIVKKLKEYDTVLRIGVNAGSLDRKFLLKYGKPNHMALIESAAYEMRLLEKHNFYNFKISVKHHDVSETVKAYIGLAKLCDYPLHLGVTEAGPTLQGVVKSSVAFTQLLSRGIGDTIRVSLSDSSVSEVKAGIKILESLELRKRSGVDLIACPGCGRLQVNLYRLVDEVGREIERLYNKHPSYREKAVKVAVMGCIVNGPGEAVEADIGVAAGNKKGQIFRKGKIIKTVREEEIVKTLIEEVESFYI